MGRWNIFLANSFSIRPVKIERFHRYQVNDTFKVLFCANWELHEYSITLHLVSDLLNNTLGVGSSAVHFINKGNPWHMITLHLPIHCE